MEQGIKETKEAMLATYLLGKFVIERLKDGFQLDDALALGTKLMDSRFRDLVVAGAQGADKIPAELGDLSLVEVIELAKVIIDMVEGGPRA